MNILVLVCSTNKQSNSEFLADMFLKGAEDACACNVQKLRLIEFELPQFTVDCYTDNCVFPKQYSQLKNMIEEADGVLIATPIWNFGVPAHLKNFIDWMGCFGLDPETRTKGTLEGKPFYFIFTGGAPKAVWKGLMRFTTMFVREGIRYYGGTVAGLYYEGRCTPGRGQFGLVVDKREESMKAVRNRGKWFAAFTDGYKKSHRLPLRHRLFERVYKAGQRVAAKI
ncbi:MAG: NAD(P)H-dependent oxidoreductase [Candidatus Peribacter sp.]|jgi:NAD(P)H-dependent FMN reductase|nr:NAD(P)H-dependent oxidoreductase [Candidatus Peribacter sp.]MBT4392885.1 NAD(P)H-dependent oxidoreductase [Candidatus Peribacter sp.]MBT4601369.1 NAD(P)H-dependent oxidoreductase [Candidatus Peribacter sp.]MBT5149379.1 NAD(P)H-dependent oxidoreductase [Candidatus Peribacter sp.]MBT5637512.1 NAD(P)H-dependent oxidoreductase [Candidatus Peribacter sp.]